jgi:LysM repeat protein
VRRALVVIAALVAPALAQVDATDTVSYRVHQNDTLDVIAAEFYGDKSQAMFIVVENHLADAKTGKVRAIHGGDRLKIPVTREIATAKGDQLESLAQNYLGDARRAPFLADFNSIAIDDSLAAGTVLTIPLHVTHVATTGESLAQISTTYFGDAKQAEMLKRYNNLDRNSIEKGDSIVVPNLHAHVRAGKMPAMDAESKDRRDRQRKAQADIAEALPRARSSWLLGDFAQVKAALEHVADEADYLDAKSAVECVLLLGKAHIAFDERDAAAAAFARVLDRRPHFLLSAYAESPKVLDAWRKAGGHVEGE